MVDTDAAIVRKSVEAYERLLTYEYDQRRNRFSGIRADYVIKSFTDIGRIFLFLAKEKESGNVRGCSIFVDDETDYSLNQIRTTVLSVAKIARPILPPSPLKSP